MTLASRLLGYLCDDMLQVGERRSVRTVDSCTWWPHDVAECITTRPITDQAGVLPGTPRPSPATTVVGWPSIR